ncbi:DUF317 domain-containing protein [Streptomyces sp. NPDC001315]|uniref:DUF317 domain-containing protein n=1 Tax=Streptomyces sp. NPDC001315 TaxID=3364562 RepID=UPI0036A1812B
MNASSSLLPAVIRPAVEERAWLSSDHCAGPVLELLGALGWAIVDTPEANVHCTSPDGRVYVGWLPEDTAAWKRGIVWQVRVIPANAEPWLQEFGLYTPSEAVAGFLAALIAGPSRTAPQPVSLRTTARTTPPPVGSRAGLPGPDQIERNTPWPTARR